tara:strand:- start:155 stop:385 length:231 start_codon:yes stop_codon:yes gene_type:complete
MPRKPMNKAAFKGGKDIRDPDYYEHWADLHRITQAIKGLKSDLKRDCIPYYKYDELCEQISGMQIKIKLKDTTKHG